MVDTGRLIEALTGDHFVEHGRDRAGSWGEHIKLSPQAANHLAKIVLDLLDSDGIKEVASIYSIPPASCPNRY